MNTRTRVRVLAHQADPLAMNLVLRPLVLALGALALSAPALAVTGGSVDGSAHSAVGLLVVDAGGGLRPQCSGTLVSPTVFLTAAHCTARLPSRRVWVAFDPAYTFSSSLLAGTATSDPLYGADKQDSHDIAVVELDEPVTGIAPLSLPGAGVLDAKPRLENVVVVGYGADQAAADKHDPSFTYDFVRRFALDAVDGVSKTELRLSSRDGGTCYGDSGGPELLGSTVVAVTSHGDSACTKQSFGYRADTAGARAFPGRFLALP